MKAQHLHNTLMQQSTWAYDVPHALRQVQAYLTTILEGHSQFFEVVHITGCCKELCKRATGRMYGRTVVDWTLMADKYDMRGLCGHCERVMVIYWECFQDNPVLVDQLSSSALRRIAKGLHKTLVASLDLGPNCYIYPSADDFTDWVSEDDYIIFGGDAPGVSHRLPESSADESCAGPETLHIRVAAWPLCGLQSIQHRGFPTCKG